MKNIKKGDLVIYQKCSCGETDLTIGKIYEILEVRDNLIMFLDDNNNKRVKSLLTKCFKKID